MLNISTLKILYSALLTAILLSAVGSIILKIIFQMGIGWYSDLMSLVYSSTNLIPSSVNFPLGSFEDSQSTSFFQKFYPEPNASYRT